MPAAIPIYWRKTAVGTVSAAGEVDGAVVDINLGQGPNFDFARRLFSRGTPFVFVTGYDAAVVPSELSHVPRIEKPVRERQLITALAEVARTRA